MLRRRRHLSACDGLSARLRLVQSGGRFARLASARTNRDAAIDETVADSSRLFCSLVVPDWGVARPSGFNARRLLCRFPSARALGRMRCSAEGRRPVTEPGLLALRAATSLAVAEVNLPLRAQQERRPAAQDGRRNPGHLVASRLSHTNAPLTRSPPLRGPSTLGHLARRRGKCCLAARRRRGGRTCAPPGQPPARPPRRKRPGQPLSMGRILALRHLGARAFRNGWRTLGMPLLTPMATGTTTKYTKDLVAKRGRGGNLDALPAVVSTRFCVSRNARCRHKLDARADFAGPALCAPTMLAGRW